MGDKVDLNMTPMIDVVFQLLAFFIMTLKFVIPEGDFNIKMPATAPSDKIDDQLVPPIVVKITANANGSLKSIYVNNAFIADFPALRSKIISSIGPLEKGPGASGSTAEVELDCEYGLRYENVIQAVTHVSGYIDESGQTIKLVEKIKFKPPVKKPGA